MGPNGGMEQSTPSATLSHDDDEAVRPAKPLQAYRRGACSIRIGVGVAVAYLPIGPCAVNERFNGIAHDGNGLAAPVDCGRSRERPFALDLVCALLCLRSAARNDKDVRRAQLAKVTRLVCQIRDALPAAGSTANVSPPSVVRIRIPSDSSTVHSAVRVPASEAT